MFDGEPAVTIGGVSYTGRTLNNAQFTFGAPDFLAGVQPPYGNITLLNTTGSPLTIYLADDVVVTVWNAAKTVRRTIFTGVISDVSVSLLSDDTAFYDLTVVGNSQFFEARVINQLGLPGQLDSERITELVRAGTGTPIDLLSGTINAQTGTINAFPSYLGTITASPSADAVVVALPAEAAVAGQLIADFAADTSGWVWESRTGVINFRPFDALSATSFTVPQGAIYVQRLRRTSTLTELYNQIVIEKNDSDTWPLVVSHTENDLTSQGNYGTRNYTLVTQYAYQAAASRRWEPQAEYLLDFLADNINQLDGLVVDVTSDALTDAVRNNLIECDMTQTVNFTLPTDIFPAGTGSGRVCGWSWTVADKILDLTINLVKVA
jgi:hypothetical protein